MTEDFLCTCVRLRNPLDHRMRKLWSQGPMLLLASYLKVSAGDWLQLLSLEPTYLSPHYYKRIRYFAKRFTKDCYFLITIS